MKENQNKKRIEFTYFKLLFDVDIFYVVQFDWLGFKAGGSAGLDEF